MQLPEKKHKKFFGALIATSFLWCFLFLIFCKNVNAVGLEIQYPALQGAPAIGAETKLPEYMIYLFNAGMSVGFFAIFISLAIAGAMYFLSPAKPDLLADARDRVGGAISGLLILTLTYLIITTINPQLNVFRLNDLPPAPPPPAEKKQPGVYFYKSDCSDKNTGSNTSNVADFNDLRNMITDVSTVQDAETQSAYITVLYDNPGFWGKCQYITDATCKHVDNFATSASVYKYDFNPDGDGVYFYRKSYFNNEGGSYKVSNSQIKGIYIEKLDNLKFQNVPEQEQLCSKYDDNHNCLTKEPQSLSGENISSVKIKGDYVVLFIYFGPNDASLGPWTACQEFPTANDVNNLGPQQIKWERARNSGPLPNYVAIIPVKK